MAEKLKFEVPKKSETAARVPGIVTLILVLVLIIGILNAVLLVWKSGTETITTPAGGLSATALKDLALKLEKQKLTKAAASVWNEYLDRAQIGNEEQAKVRYRMGKLYQEAGGYEDALKNYYRSEYLARVADIEPEIGRRIEQCLESLGKFASLRYELADRVGMDDTEGGAGGEVVAEIGTQKITKAGLDQIIEEKIERMLSQYRSRLTPEQVSRQKEMMLARFSGSEERLKALEQHIMEEVLYRRAREMKLAEEAETQKLLNSVEKSILAERMAEKEIKEKVNITESDVKNYYEAHKDEYMQSERAQISHILVSDEKTAEEILGKLAAGAAFEELAKEYSTDKNTADKGGQIAGWVEKGSRYVAGIGASKEAADVIFSTEEGKVAEKAVKSSRGFHVIMVNKREAERQKPYEEVKEKALNAMRAQKQQEVLKNLIDELKERYDVVIHRSEFEDKKDASEERDVPKKD